MNPTFIILFAAAIAGFLYLIPIWSVPIVVCIAAMVLLIVADIHFLHKRAQDDKFDPWDEI